MPSLSQPALYSVFPAWPWLLAVPALLLPNDSYGRHPLCSNQVAVSHLVSDHASAHSGQEQCLDPRIAAPTRHELVFRLGGSSIRSCRSWHGTNRGRQLAGRVKIDDAYLGDERAGKPGRGSANKVPFIMAASTVEGGQLHHIVLRSVPFTSESVADWASGAERRSPCGYGWLACVWPLRAEIDDHEAIVTGSGHVAAEHAEFRWVNIMLGNLKTTITSTYHAFKFGKYMARYLGAFRYRFNHRYNLRAMLQQLVHATTTITLLL